MHFALITKPKFLTNLTLLIFLPRTATHHFSRHPQCFTISPIITKACKEQMAPHNDDMPFRFLDLPGELRNKIYAFIFEDAYEATDLHLLVTPCYYSTTALTTVSQQIRTETLELYKQAARTYWASHSFYIEVDCEDSRDLVEDQYHEATRLPKGVIVQGMSFWFSSAALSASPGHALYAKLSIHLDVGGNVVWTSALPPTTVMPQVMVAWTEQMLIDFSTEDTAFLDVDQAATESSAPLKLRRHGTECLGGFNKENIIALCEYGEYLWGSSGGVEDDTQV